MYSDQFENFVRVLFVIEGILTTDTGGLTKYGISQRAYPELDIENLTLAQAKDIYWRDYYNPLRIDEIPDKYLAAQLFVFGVNAGVGDAKNHIWKLLGITGATIFGDITLGRLKEEIARDADGFLSLFIQSEIRHYFDLVRKDFDLYFPQLEGWMNRLAKACNL